ncbi:hypothetical protein A3K73_07230 [Candidatus Pacearchaeota archaeon RBG_13_36_9]|nr:MAG: hypothetical protein A3K73_07230 [Candidatus Pacearchaeota archaeon RBG_13_36_9]
MKKEGIIIFLGALLVLSACLAAAANDTKVEKAYDCLDNLVKDKCDQLSIEEKTFTAMATGKCISELVDVSKDDECWPDSGCSLRDTALSVLALRRNNKDTDKAESWLLNRTEVSKDLIWYLEIDAQEETKCSITYKSRSYEITVKSDKKLSGSAGSCLSVDAGSYWLKIDDSCYTDNFTISCDKDFITALLYKKKTGATIYVSSKTNFGSSQGRTEEKVNARCFGAGCDYEGSLWATIALAETGNDVSPYIPYLIAMADENKKYFPSAFLYILTEYDEFFSDIIELQASDYWKITDSPYHQFYDTALAMLSLQGIDAEQATLTKDYLLEVQGEDGCWRSNVRDTAFILYAVWPKAISTPDQGTTTDYCEDFDYFCVSSTKCESSDTVNLPCEVSRGMICCKVEPQEETCAEKGGEICEGDEKCSGSYIAASDSASKCCKGTCAVPVPVEDPECVKANNTCRSSCYEDETEVSLDCEEGSSDVCCKYSPPGRSYWWIYLLIGLIVLVALGIVFKDRLRAFIFQMQNKMKRGRGAPPPGPPGRRFPPTFPSQVPGRPMQRMIIPRQPLRPGQQPPRPGQQQVPRPGQPSRPMPQIQSRKPAGRPAGKPSGKTDKELEETLKKLKEMSK